MRSTRADASYSTRWVLVLLALATGGCKATATDVDRWARTERGPTKLSALVEAPRYGVELRAHALLTIATMDRSEPRPLDVFRDALTHLAASDDPHKDEVLAAVVPGLERALGGGDRAARPGAPPSATQGAAKDAAVELAPRLQGAPRERLMRAVMDYFVADFAGRSGVGTYGAEDATRAFGPPAASLLARALDAHLDKDSITRIATIVAAVGDDATKTTTGERLVAIEREVEGAAFMTWLTGEIRRSLSVGTEAPSETRVLASATLTREALLVSGVFPAMKSFAAVPAVGTRILEIAAAKPAAELAPAIRAMLEERRSHALNALEGGANAGQVEPLLALALDASQPATLREVAFDRLAETRAPSVIPRMWPLIAATAAEGDASAQQKARSLRARAAELVLQIGGAASLPQLFANLPADPAVVFDPGELEGYANRIVTWTPVPPSLRTDLRTGPWWRRVIALHVLAKTGSAADVALLERLTSDATPTVGAAWRSRDPAQDTVGKVAAAALVAMRERLATPPSPND